MPEVGPITASASASAIVATVGSGEQFNNGREFAASLGLTPLNKSSGGKERLGHISKMGDQYKCGLLVLGMTSRIRTIRSEPEKFDPWFADILSRKPSREAAVAIANNCLYDLGCASQGQLSIDTSQYASLRLVHDPEQ